MAMLKSILLILCYLLTNTVNAQVDDNQNCCPKPEIEIGVGPQWSIPVILDSEVGVLGGTPEKESKLNYTFYTTIRTHPALIQAGMEIIHDRNQFNVYLPLFWPSMETSSWDHVYTAYRLGVGAHVRLNTDRFFIQAGGANMFNLSRESKIELEEPGVGTTSFDGSYSSKNGWSLQMRIGYKWNQVQRLSTSLGLGLETWKHEYENETYLHYWKVRTNMVNLTLNYRLNNPEAK